MQNVRQFPIKISDCAVSNTSVLSYGEIEEHLNVFAVINEFSRKLIAMASILQTLVVLDMGIARFLTSLLDTKC